MGSKYRNPNLFSIAESLVKSDFYTQDQYRSIKQRKLQSILSFYNIHSNHLKGKIQSKDPFEALNKLPILTKKELIENHNEMQCYDAFDKLFIAETSGSTGHPLRFKKDLNWDTHHRASIIRSCRWYGVEPWETNGYFWGYSFKESEVLKTKFSDLLQNRFRVFNYDQKDIASFLRKLKSASYVHGYSSMIYETAKLALEYGLSARDFPYLKMVKGTSEKIHDSYQSPVMEAFGHKMVSEYGSAEAGIIAFECPHGKMHVNEENVILEVINKDIVVTNLNAYSVPILRYRLGDQIIMGSGCSCGRHSKTIDEVIGRSGKIIQGENNKFPSLTLYYVFKNIAIEHDLDIMYKGVQKEKGKLEIHIADPLIPAQIELILKEALSYFQNDIKVEIIDNADIHSRKGKKVDFETFIN